MTTISDIAQKAGVAKSTVSRYLNHGYVSEKTRKKIEKIIEETGYKPNAFAQSLKAQETNLIGVMIPRLNSPSTNDVLKGMDEANLEKDYQMLIMNSNQEEKRELENIDMLVKQKVAGIIFFAREMTPPLVDKLKKLTMPVLILGQEVPGFHCIIHDDYAAGKKIGEYALSLGHRNFLFVGVNEKDQAVGVYRKQGFLDAVSKEKATVNYIETTFSRKETYQHAKVFLKDMKATYVCCATDNIALATLKAAYECGYQVPKDFSLSGFGGYDATEYVFPTITTVLYPYPELGKQAIELMSELITEKEVPLITSLPNTLKTRQSTVKKI